MQQLMTGVAWQPVTFAGWVALHVALVKVAWHVRYISLCLLCHRQFDAAWEHLAEANRLQRTIVSYDAKHDALLYQVGFTLLHSSCDFRCSNLASVVQTHLCTATEWG